MECNKRDYVGPDWQFFARFLMLPAAVVLKKSFIFNVDSDTQDILKK